MSCQNCENADLETYIRVGNGNVLVFGCLKHIKELIEIYRKGLKSEKV